MKPGLKIESVFRETKLTVCDGKSTTSLWLKPKGVDDLIGLLEEVREHQNDDPEDD